MAVIYTIYLSTVIVLITHRSNNGGVYSIAIFLFFNAYINKC